VVQNDLAVSSSGGVLIRTEIKHPREHPQLSRHIDGIRVMKLAGKEPIRRLEIDLLYLLF